MRSTVHIFLSYAREDIEKVENIYQKLSTAGFKPWMDKKDILPGERWKSSIRKAIRRSDFFLVCLSVNSVNKRGFLQREIKEALDIWQEMLDSDIYLIPVRMENCEVPEILRGFQWANLFEENGWAQIVKAIQAGMERREIKPIVQESTPVESYSAHAKLSPSMEIATPEKGPERELSDADKEGGYVVKAPEKILIVEDEADWRNILLESLASERYSIKMAKSYADAVDILEREFFPVVILDNQLGKKDQLGLGKQLIHKIALLNNSTRVIVVSGSQITSREDVRNFFKEYNNVFDYFDKVTFSQDKFRAAVKDAVEAVNLSRMEKAVTQRGALIHRELVDIEAEIQALDKGQQRIDYQLQTGRIDIGRAEAMLVTNDKKMFVLIVKMQTILRGTPAEELINVLEMERAGQSEEAKQELSKIAEKESWAQAIWHQIDKHKGSIAAIVTSVAIEVIKNTLRQ